MYYKEESQSIGVSTFAITHELYIHLVFVNFVSHKPTPNPKIAKELPPLSPEGKIIFLKSLPSKIFRTASTQAKQTEI